MAYPDRRRPTEANGGDKYYTILCRIMETPINQNIYSHSSMRCRKFLYPSIYSIRIDDGGDGDVDMITRFSAGF